MNRLPVTIALCVASLACRAAFAQPHCDALDLEPRTRAEQLMAELYIHDCCDQVLGDCLRQVPPCSLAVRLADNVCRRVAQGQDDERIRLAMAQRARTFLPGYEPVVFDLDGVPVAGEPDAPVEVVEFADARGVHCARVTPGLLDAVQSGALAGKARLHLVPFPLRANPHAKEAGLAFLAAHDLGGFWAYLCHAYGHFAPFGVEDLPRYAEAVGLDRGLFQERMADPAQVERLVAGKRAGLDVGVDATPTFFIDGRRYEGEVEVEELIDVLEEIHERRVPGPEHGEN